jgi:drug/metabolite transporter (DMT)-like permease
MSRRGWVLFGLMALLWGIPYLLIKIADEGVSVWVLVFARTGIGAVALLPFALRRGGLAILRRHWLPLLAFAATEILVPWFLLPDAEHRLPSSLTGMLIAAVPIVGALMDRTRERLGPLRWTGLLIGFGGVVLLAGPDLIGGGGDTFAIVEVLITAILYAIAPRVVASRLADVPGPLMTSASLGFAAILYAPAAVLTWPASFPGTSVLLALLGLGLVCTALGFIVFFALVRAEGPGRAMVFTYFNPPIAVLAGALVLNESITPLTIAAFVLILGGSVFATLRATPTGPAPVSPPRPAPSPAPPR